MSNPLPGYFASQDYLNSMLSGYSGIMNQQQQQLPMFDFLSQYFQKGAQSGMPYKDQLLQTSTGAIKSQYNQAGQNLQDTMSAKGLGKSGIAISAGNQLQGQESGALNQATSQINEQDIAFRNQMIAQLLGLSGMQGQYNLGQNQQKLGAFSTMLGGGLEQQRLSQQQQQQDSSFWASILGDVGKVGAAALPLLFSGAGGNPANVNTSNLNIPAIDTNYTPF